MWGNNSAKCGNPTGSESAYVGPMSCRIWPAGILRSCPPKETPPDCGDRSWPRHGSAHARSWLRCGWPPALSAFAVRGQGHKSWATLDSSANLANSQTASSRMGASASFGRLFGGSLVRAPKGHCRMSPKVCQHPAFRHPTPPGLDLRNRRRGQHRSLNNESWPKSEREAPIFGRTSDHIAGRQWTTPITDIL